METAGLDRLFADRRLNAGIGWAIVGALVAVGVEELLAGDLLWAAFVAGAVTIAVLPAVAYRSPWVMPHWEVLAIAALAVFVRAFTGRPFTLDLATYLSVAALALIVAVELHTFTAVRMSVGFAVVFVVVTTMATAGIWAVVRWGLDLTLATGFIEDERALMVEFVASTVAGIGGGVVFERYFRRGDRLARVPDDVAAEIAEELSEFEDDAEADPREGSV